MRLKEIPKTEKPREKLLQEGVTQLSTFELLALLLVSGSKTKDVAELAYEVLAKLDKIADFENISLEELCTIKGIGVAKATTLLAAIELGKRVFLMKEEIVKLDTPISIFHYSKYLFYGKMQEYFYCFYVDARKKFIGKKLLFIGTMNRSVVHPREVFKEAYRLSASGIICVHNHPSGIVYPSQKDIEFTKDLIEIGNFQGIPILDHLIVSEHNYFSFGENNTSFIENEEENGYTKKGKGEEICTTRKNKKQK